MNAVRNKVFALHKWFGLAMAFFFAFMFLTGGALSVADYLIWLAKPELRVEQSGTQASVGAVYDAAQRARPDATIFVLERMEGAGLGDKVYTTGRGEGPLIVNVDPYTLEIQDIDIEPRAITAIKKLHKDLYIPKGVGHFLISATSVVLLYSILSGLITYRRFWKGFFRLPTSDSPRRTYWGMMHRLLALWAVPFLLIMALTASFYLMEDLRVAGERPPPAPLAERDFSRPDGFGGKDLDRLIAGIRQEYPSFEPRTVLLPATSRRPIQISGPVGRGEILGPHSFTFDPADMSLVAHDLPTDGKGLSRYKPLITALHYGHWAGFFSQVLWLVFAGLAIALIWAGLKIRAARTATNDLGTLRSSWQALGWIRWAYVAAVIGATSLALIT